MGNFIWPCPGYSRVTCAWGTPRSYGHHLGVDIGVPRGSKLIAPRGGVVEKAGWLGTYGKQVFIDHGNGVKTRCAHCDRVMVKVGQRVSAGQLIALSGNTGHSTGPHLHFEIWINGRDVNPLSRVSIRDSRSKYSGKKISVSTKNSGKKRKKKTTKPITKVSTESEKGKVTVHSGNSLRGKKTRNRGRFELLMQHDGKVFQPEVEEPVTISWERKGTPGKMEFTVFNDKTLKVHKGDAVRFRVAGKGMFFGYVFATKYVRKNWMAITCYDQLRYLTNQDVLSYKNKTYSQLLKSIARQYKLPLGTVDNTKHIIKQRIEEGTLFDILQNASNITFRNTGKSFVLYDNFGKLCLKNRSNMKVPILIDADVAEGYEYESSIDSNAYNRVKLYIDNEKTGIREVYVYNNTHLQKRWGVLQLTKKAASKSPAKAKKQAKTIGKKYDNVRRKLSFKGCFGDTRVRAGSLVKVEMVFCEKKQYGWMIVESVTHTFGGFGHTMDLELIAASEGFYV